MICSKCGENNPNGLNYCKFCGERLGEAVRPTPEVNIRPSNRKSFNLSGWEPIINVLLVVGSYALFIFVLLPVDIIFGIGYGIKNRNKESRTSLANGAYRFGWFVGTIIGPAIIGMLIFPYMVAQVIMGLIFGNKIS